MAAVRHQPVDRVPTDIWSTPEVIHNLMEYFCIATGGVSSRGKVMADSTDTLVELYDRLDIDGLFYLFPPYIGPTVRQEEGFSENVWGMKFHDQDYPGGMYSEQVHYPLAEAETIADLEAYPWPDPDWYDYAAIPSLGARYTGRAICFGSTACFYYHNMLRGLELSLMDPLLRPDFTHHLIQHLSDFFNEFHRRCFEAGRGLIDMTQVTDDLGSQHGLLISPQVFDSFYRSVMQRAIDQAHSYGILVFHHDDGDCRRILPRLVEMGIDVLNPIQWRNGGWDLSSLKRDFGSRVCFHSAVDNQQTLPFGTPADVRLEVHRLIETLSSDHTGFIIGPCHDLQPNTPIENILALYEAAHEFGQYGEL
jgi:uroporphyrinogen decarboxylase